MCDICVAATFCFFFFFNDTATTEIYTLSLHDALPICGEVIEHLINPGQFLMQLHAAKCPIIVTVPNAFGSAGMKCIRNTGYENVNKDHVAYYSYGTFRVLAQKCRFSIG